LKRNLSITIGITAFNEGSLLNEAWNSVLNQNTDKWMAVMVLDGGGDRKTRKHFESIQHPNLKKYSYSSNQGIYPCRTKAIKLADTEWYFHLDADDLLPPNAIELVIKNINKNPNIEFLAGACKSFNLGPEKIMYPQNNPEVLCTIPLFLPQSPITKTLFEKMGGYYIPDHFLHCDWDFWLSVYEKNIIGAKINEVIYLYRRRNNSVTSKNFDSLCIALECVISRHPSFFHSKERKQRTRSDNYEKIARHYRSKGNRKLAKEYADLALKEDNNSQVLKSINREYEMSALRYFLRRMGRLI